MKKIKKRMIKVGIGLVLLIIAIILDKTVLEDLAWYFRIIPYLPAYIVSGFDVIRKAAMNISKGQVLDENFLMLIATIGAFVVQEYIEAVAVMIFYQVGEIFQSYAMFRSRRSISSLMDIRPDYANLVTDEGTNEVAPESVAIGDIILIKPGERIPLDGIVIEGASSVDTKALTGESVPRDYAVGDEVISGCVNLSAALKVRVTKPFGESTVAKVLDLVENAYEKKAKSENFITKFAKYYTPAVVIGALLLAVIPPLIIGPGKEVFMDWIFRALTCLVVSCPCALVISVPLSFFGGIGGASKAGLLIKGGNYIEALATLETVVFDKTGTLTKANPVVADVIAFNDANPDEMLRIAACLEEHFPHSMANAVVNRAREKNLSHEEMHSEVKYVVAHGIASSIEDKDAIIGSYHFVFEDEGSIIPDFSLQGFAYASYKAFPTDNVPYDVVLIKTNDNADVFQEKLDDKIDGKYYRTDCSGYVDAVLAKMNIIDTTAASNAFMEDKELKDALTNAGFTYAILTDAADITSTSIIVKSGLVAIIVPNNEYDEYTLYCWSSSQATVKSLSADQINEYGFTNIYSLTE